MARRVFFSFHYERDVWRAGVVRNSWVSKPNREVAGFWDAATWEEVKKKGDEAIKKWIDKQLEGTSVTAVLIGTETSTRKYVEYEIIQSYNKGNGLLGVYIHNIRDQNQRTEPMGENPFNRIYIERNGQRIYFSQIYSTYDWVTDNGYENFGDWVEKAAKDVGR